MIKVILIDDEPLSREIVKSYLTNDTKLEIVAECNDGFEGVKAIEEHKPDLVFLDIQMPKINGFEMLELLDHNPSIIFCTAFDEYAIKAFEKNAIDYLLKPFSKERFEKAVAKFKENFDRGNQLPLKSSIEELGVGTTNQLRIVVKTGTKVKIIPTHEIHYLQSDDDFVKVITAEGSYLKNKTMQYYENNLDAAQFIRVHRSYMVQLNQVSKIERQGKESHVVLLRTGAEIPVSKTGYTKLREALGL